MRLCTSLSLVLAAAVVLVPGPEVAADAGATPACAAPGERAFPLATRIHDGPTSYEPGGGFGTWYVDLTNTTRRTCSDIHPVVVLVDDKRALRANQAHLDFYDGPRARPVTFESTDEHELIGVLDGPGFPGFTVPPGRTVSVKVRLAIGPDAAVEQVTANAAVVQRRGQDGDWVGESNAYRFGIGMEVQDPTPEPGRSPDAERTPQEEQVPGADQTPVQDRTPGTGQTPGGEQTRGDEQGAGKERVPGDEQAAGKERVPADHSRGSRGSWDVGAAQDPSLPFAEDAQEAGQRARELARTGVGVAHGLLAAAAALLCVAGSAFLLARRRR
ncbi:hypothetical protein [Streptomyces sp. AF1A]|jgi:hypothetical protein|uniref:hypothetical protein n=1 Tax=Streptomyces sp. AF1A TaxID=3394350 RepID=UPI0039BD2ADD